MAEVNKVQGPSGTPDAVNKKNTPPNADSFKAAMEQQRRITEVSAVDPDEQKKRKQQAEENEDSPSPLQEPLPTSQITPFDLSGESDLFAIQPTDEGSAPPVAAPTLSTTPPPSVNTNPISASADAEKTATPTYQASSTQPSVSNTTTPETSTAIGPPDDPNQVSAPGQPKSITTPPGPPLSTTPLATSSTNTPYSDTATFFEQLSSQPLQPEKKPSDPSLLNTEDITLPSSQPSSFVSANEETNKKESIPPIDANNLTTDALANAALPLSPQEQPTPTTTPYLRLPTAVQELFNTMVGVISIVQDNGIAETTFTLNSPQFASSVFFGSQIIIQEFSTAQSTFNIQLIGSPQAVTLFQANANDLMAAFQAGNYTFKVNRLETHVASEGREEFLFRRKESAQQQGQGQRNQ